MLKILHGADLHLDSPFDGLSDEKAAQRREEQRALLEEIAELCNREQVDLVLLAGDLLDSGRSYYETGEVLLRAFSQIRGQIFIAPGNHDYYSSRSPYANLEFPENVHIFPSNGMQRVVLPDLGCTVYGAGFTSVSAPSLLTGFHVQDEGTVNLMVLHGDTQPGSSYNPITTQEIQDSGLDYLALGHIHTCSGVLKAGATYYAYPGCAQGRGFDETGEKGVLIGTVAKGVCDLRFQPLQGRRYLVREVDVTDAADAQAALAAALPQEPSPDICRIVLTGEYDGRPDVDALAALAESRYFSATVRDRTRIRRDIDAMAAEDTLKGLFLHRLKTRYDASQSEEERRVLMLAMRYGISALENGEVWF